MRVALIAGAGMLVVPCLVAMLVPSVRGLEDDGAPLVDEHAVLEMPFDGAGEHDALDVAADPR